MSSCIPNGIRMSSTCLVIPSFEELGMSIPIMSFASIRLLPHVTPEISVTSVFHAPGIWIKRGDPVLELRYLHFHWEFPPNLVERVTRGDKTGEIVKVLRSPADGLLIALRDQRREIIDREGKPAVNRSRVLPVLLLPQNEPPVQSYYYCEPAYGVLGAIRDQADRLFYSYGTPSQMRQEWKFARSAFSSEISRFRLDPDPSYREVALVPFDRSREDWVGNVQALRTGDYELRRALEHLVADEPNLA